MKNEFGEELTKEEIQVYSEKVRLLSRQQIDQLWFDCEWISERKGANQSLPDQKITAIKQNNSEALAILESLLLETPKKLFLKKLSIICSEKKMTSRQIDN